MAEWRFFMSDPHLPKSDLANHGRGLHVVTFVEAHRPPTVTQHKVGAAIHYDHQVGGLLGLPDQHFSQH
jgi:hypothetical protein